MDFSERSCEPFSILIVDDYPDAAESLAEWLGLEGFAARPVTSGDEALREVAADLPDAVVLDVRMPGMDGRDLARRLAGLESLPLMIAVTGCDSPRERELTLAVGVHMYMRKPVNHQLLLAVLRQHATNRLPRGSGRTELV